MKIVIYGLSKTGTSALFYKIKNSLPDGTAVLFEPQSFGILDRLRWRVKAAVSGNLRPHAVAKVLPLGAKAVRVRDFEHFDRQILITRDPRDRMVSLLLYRTYHAGFVDCDRDAALFVDLLRAKESDPVSVSLQELAECFRKLVGESSRATDWLLSCGDHFRSAMRFHDDRPQLFQFRYEDMIDGRFDGLERFLGFPLSAPTQVDLGVERVVRSRAYGGWRDWFTAADVEALTPMIEPYLQRYYPSADWTLPAEPNIDPIHGSLYVERLIAARRALRDMPPLLPRGGC